MKLTTDQYENLKKAMIIFKVSVENAIRDFQEININDENAITFDHKDSTIFWISLTNMEEHLTKQQACLEKDKITTPEEKSILFSDYKNKIETIQEMRSELFPEH